MYPKLVILALGLASLKGVLSQTTTATILPDDDLLQGVAGEIVGTGADGTTYVISGSLSGVRATATLVEDATHISQVAEAVTSSVTVKINEECGYDSNHEGSCTAVVVAEVEGFSTASTVTASGTIHLNAVPLTTAKSAAVSAFSFKPIPFVASIVSGAALLFAA